MKFNGIMKILKPSQWYHWVGYGTVGTVLSSGIAIGVVFGVKNNNEEKPNTSAIIPNQNGSSSEKKQGKQMELPSISSRSIEVQKTLIPNLISQGPLDVSKVVDAFKALQVPVDISKGTSYDKKHGTHKVIGNKHHAIDRFVNAWNKLSRSEKSSLNRHSFAYLFGYNPESDFHVGHQVEYILIDPVNKASTTSTTSGSTSGITQAVVDDFVKWVKTLNHVSFAQLVDSLKLPSAITSTDVLQVMKNLPSFKVLTKTDQNKLSTSNIKLYNVFDKSGEISIKITQNGKELIKIKALSGFKKFLITRDIIDLAIHYKKALSDSIDSLKTFKTNGAKNISYYEFKNGNSMVTYPIVADTDSNLDKNAKSILKEFGFTPEKIYTNITSADLSKSFTGKSSIHKSILKIGYLSSRDKKYYLLNDHSTPYNTIDDAVVAFMQKNKKTSGTLEEFVKSELNAIKKQLIDFGISVSTPDLDKIISASTTNIVVNILKQLSANQKVALSTLIDKYIPGGSNISSKFPGKVFIKDASGKYMNGSKKYPASFKIGNDFNVIWGLFNAKKGHIQNATGNISKFKNFRFNIFGHVDAIAVVDTGKNDRSKKITFVFFKIGSQWIFATNYINYIEGNKPEGVVKIITNSSDTHSTVAIMNKDFSDLVKYTKASLSKS